jgi:phosphate transport system substrate-binding protein
VNQSPTHRLRRFSRVLVAAACSLATAGIALPGRANADTFVPISGAGSTWSANAMDQWIGAVSQYGMRVNYAPTGSSDGRSQFRNGTVDFAASDIPFQAHPNDGSPPENVPSNTYAYMPITSGGTVFMYNLTIAGHRVTNLRLSGTNIAKIFTGGITNWNDPALLADNPQLALPNRRIVPVVRSDGSGSTAQFTTWMIATHSDIWNAYCQRSGRAPTCGLTSNYPTIPGMVAQAGDLGVAGYVAQSYADGAIGYVNYSYALVAHFPVAKMLNSAGYYTEPTPKNVAVSLLKANVDTTHVDDPSRYLTEDLTQVYTDPDPRTYPLSSYSYMILPTQVQGQFTTTQGKTLAAFSYYAMCQGQQSSESLGYSPMPINLVQDSFAQIRKIPGAVVQNINIQQCNNPTFSPDGTNLLADQDPMPPACDKQGPIQCSTGTGGALNTATPASHNASGSGTGTAGSAANASSAGSGTNSSGTSSANGSSAVAPAGDSSNAVCDPSTANCSTGTGGAGQAAALTANPLTVGTPKGWSQTQTLMLLVGLFLLMAVVTPGVLSWKLKRTN